MASPSTPPISPTVAGPSRSTPKRRSAPAPAAQLNEVWEEYHPSQDEDEEEVDDTASASVSVTSSSKRVSTPKSRARQSGRSAGEAASPRRNGTPVRRRKPPGLPPKVAVTPKREPRGVASPMDVTSSALSRPPRSGTPPSGSTAILDHLIWGLSLFASIAQRLVLFALSILSTLLAPYLLPLFLGISGILIAGLTAYFLLPLLPAFLVNLSAKALRSAIPSAIWAAGSLSNLGVTRSAAIVPARVLVTPACTLLGLGCQYSLLSSVRPTLVDPTIRLDDGLSEGKVARPFWEWNWGKIVPSLGVGGGGRTAVDVAGIARGLGREVKQARDIFESVQSMSSAGLVRNLHYVKIWELGVAVSVGSTLDGKDIVGRELTDLGDLARDLADEISAIDYAAVNAFTWIQWEFATLLELLDSPNPPTNATLAARLHSLISQLDTAFTELHTLTSTATETASLASVKGSVLWTRLTKIRYSLLGEKERDPIWRQAWEKNKHRLVGGEVPRSEMLDRDLRLTGDTISGLSDAKEHLERVRALTKGYKDQIGMTQARLVGFHLGAEGSGLEAEEEVRVLGRLVQGLGDAVGEAKGKSRGRGQSKKGYREIGA